MGDLRLDGLLKKQKVVRSVLVLLNGVVRSLFASRFSLPRCEIAAASQNISGLVFDLATRRLPNTQKAPRGASLDGAVSWRSGLFGPSMGLTPSRFALRGQPAAVQICSWQICRLRRQDAGANIGAADGPKGKAQDAPNNRSVRPPPLSARYAKSPTRGLFAYLAEREGDDLLHAPLELPSHTSRSGLWSDFARPKGALQAPFNHRHLTFVKVL